MIETHNFYIDLIKSLYGYITEIIPIEFYGLETNLGNITFQLNESPNHQLPRIIIDLIDVNPVNLRPVVYQFPHGDPFGQRLALNNYTKDLQIMTQENWNSITLRMNINCDSHLQALNIKHYLNNRLPVDKLLNHFEYSSFFKVPEYLIVKKLFDIENDDIDNLYMYYNKTKGINEYCFSLPFTPLMRPSGITLNLNTNNQPSFTVEIDIEVQMNLISRIVFPWLNNYTDEFEDNSILIRKDILFVPKTSKLNRQIIAKNKTTKEIKKFIINDEFVNQDYLYGFGYLKGNYIDDKFEYDIQFIEDDNIIVGKLFTTKDLKEGGIKGNFIDGKCYNLEIKDNIIECYFEGYLNEKYEEKRIKFLISEFRHYRIIKDMVINGEWQFLSEFFYYPGTIILNQDDINRNKSKLFKLSLISYNGTKLDNPIESTDGKFSEYNLDINFETSNIIRHNNDFESAIFDIEFESFSTYGVGFINQVVVNFGKTGESMISGTINLEENVSDSYNYLINNIEFEFNNLTKKYEIKLFIRNNLNNLRWIMAIPKVDFRTDYTKKDINILLDKSNNNYLVFEVTENQYFQYFNQISYNNLIFFYLKK